MGQSIGGDRDVGLAANCPDGITRGGQATDVCRERQH